MVCRDNLSFHLNRAVKAFSKKTVDCICISNRFSVRNNLLPRHESFVHVFPFVKSVAWARARASVCVFIFRFIDRRNFQLFGLTLPEGCLGEKSFPLDWRLRPLDKLYYYSCQNGKHFHLIAHLSTFLFQSITMRFIIWFPLMNFSSISCFYILFIFWMKKWVSKSWWYFVRIWNRWDVTRS